MDDILSLILVVIMLITYVPLNWK